jgi:guanine deaminase
MTAAPPSVALFGDLLDLAGNPGFEVASPSVRFRPDHWLWIDAGRIVRATPASEPPPERFERIDHAGRLILPGFIDSHVHSVQLDVIAAYGTELLDWLETHTFPAEQRQADPAVARASAEVFIRALLANGTTTAAVFPTVHKTSVDALFEAAAARGMRLITGKCLMDRHAPPGLTDTVDSGERDSLALIERWHGQGRLAYAHTVRFAPTSTPDQLRMAERLLQRFPDTYLQTHVAENRDEVRWARELFPDSRSYLAVYDDFGLLNDRSLLAHGIWFDEADHALLAQRRSVVAHSPSSNLFLGSGLMDWTAIESAGGRVALASDVGGGTSLSMLRTMASAYQVQAMRGVKLPAWKALHAATRGAAEALGLADEIGSLEPGRVADVAVWRWAVGPVAEHRDRLIVSQAGRSLHDRVFAWMTLGDDRNLVETWLAGECLHASAPHAHPAP